MIPTSDSATVSPQLAEPGEAVPVPQVIASYVAYLRTRTRAEPDISIRGDDAEVSVSAGDQTLTLAFRYSRDWALRSAGLRYGARTTRFSRGELAEAVDALVQP